MRKFLILILLITCESYAQESAVTVLNNAFEEGKKESKNIFIKFSASWCKPCHIMTERMQNESVSELFERSYVIRELIIKEYKFNKHLENPGAIEILEKYKGKRAGIPFWLIFDPDGNLLTDSFNLKGRNIGNPSKEKHVETFLSKLKETSSLNSEELKKISKVFNN